MMTQVLLVTSARESSWLDQNDNPTVRKLHDFAYSVTQADASIEVSITSLDRLRFSVDGSQIAVVDGATGRDLADFDVVHLRGVNRDMAYYADYAKAIALYVESRGKKIVDHEDIGAAFGKLSQAMLFALNDIPTPVTYSQWNGADLANFVVERSMEFPLIVKASAGTMGADNYLVKDEIAFREILSKTVEPFVVQNQIPNDGDYRVLLLGDAEPFVFWRPRIAGSHLSNTSQGSVPDKEVEIGDDALQLALRAKKVSGRRCVGVDLMQNNVTGEWIILEANSNPALATGAFNDEKAARYAEMIERTLKEYHD